jgi:hypothetical protein
LPSSHYAAGWKIDAAHRPLAEVNALGLRYAELPDEIPAVGDRLVSNPEKEGLLLELCQCFHPYLMKYLVMICRGHVPIMGVGNQPARMNPDVRPFLLYFLPKGQKPVYQNLSKVVKQLHFAFKGMETEEIYDVLMEQLMGALKGYDPQYKAYVSYCTSSCLREGESRLFGAATALAF